MRRGSTHHAAARDKRERRSIAFDENVEQYFKSSKQRRCTLVDILVGLLCVAFIVAVVGGTISAVILGSKR